MKSYKVLFHLQQAKGIQRGKRVPLMWSLDGETIDGKRLLLQTSMIGRGERRWKPTSLIGAFLRVTYHITSAGNFKADLWRTSTDEGEDLSAEFSKERTLYRVQQERLALQAAVVQAVEGPALDQRRPKRL